ncbi:MAG: phenylalanine--tRNA ligase subunit beta [Dehalococcoidia bacterium]
MKVSLKWLREYVKVTLPPQEVAERLTMAGLEVEAVEAVGEQWQGVRVARVSGVAPHPNADRLRLATVELPGESHTVVCGAPNLVVGQKVAFAQVGASLIDGHTGQSFTLKEVKIRGVSSAGMVCSEKELGLGDSHEGILELPPDAPVGAPLAEYLGDTLLEIDITPNRPDCLSVLGVAWEVGALTDEPVHPPPVDYPEDGPPSEGLAAVEIADPDLCPRYCATLIQGVKVGPSPRWLQERLISYGMRPINNIVDVTNYVMVEMGQPLHAFDLRSLSEARIVVRRARPGETVTSLDGQRRALSTDMLVIADAHRPVAVAGVMGGLETEVTPETTDILLEAASFAPASIRSTAAALKMRTEASLRFERGLSPELVPPSIRRATQLFLQVAGGRAAGGIIDVYPGRVEAKPVALPLSEVSRLLGMEIDRAEVVRVLTSLGFQCREESPEQLLVEPPYWRSDVRLPADVVEEVARVVGYDRLPTTVLSGRLPHRQPDAMLRLKERVRDILAASGLQEAITYSLVSAAGLEATGSPVGLRVANPVSREQECLRTSLRPGLLTALATNQKFGTEAVRLFEVGRTYLPREADLPQERETAAVVLWGGAGEVSWAGGQAGADFYEAKGLAGILLDRLGVDSIDFVPSDEPFLHPSWQAAITAGGQVMGVLGWVHPNAVEAFEVAGPAFYLEVDLAEVAALGTGPVAFRPLPRFPAAVRDLALVVAEDVSARRIMDILRSSPLLTEVTLFDLYRGRPIPPGHKSLAFRLRFQSPRRTLTDEEVDRAQQQLLERLGREVGASLRTS